MRQFVITGAAGFIGFHATLALLKQEKDSVVVGIDNMNPYYDVELKRSRLAQLTDYPNFIFYAYDISSLEDMKCLTSRHPDTTHVLHLAAQAGVRHGLTHPLSYAHTNLLGFVHIIEACRHWKKLEHLLYASSSSVYGGNTKYPFSVQDPVRHPLSLYAATKQSNELIAYAYHHAFHLSCTALRFFTVYGPWGRPDMAIFLFTKALFEDQPLTLFNEGNMWRSFTFIDDIVDSVIHLLRAPPFTAPLYQLLNLGSNNMHSIKEVLEILEHLTQRKASIQREPAHIMDVPKTQAGLDHQDLIFESKTPLAVGLERFVTWYKQFYLGA
ncbi:NAD-dependent epimerase/dehydratase family protein [Holospora curviuscula]|uniref:dTDP-glucose 4,6-dehydratase n=1 Tax=Holospora curviuscula TaxID=1082868 RepID=A0A2S5R6Z9_9PROT|nr:NAD-dependent epimerase/dehydratase family protein [Holospora curviuscula]PPE03119.1 dTDP-glucose 4,6-dehydratase [Holospora curviuscula]